jgi:hypothetical protein
VKKLVLLGAGTIAVASAALFNPALAVSDPGGGNALNVVGEPYAKALNILKTQGVKPTFGGSFGSDVPQSACIVSQQKMTSAGKMILNLDCTTKAVKDATANAPEATGAGGGPGAAPGAPAPGAPAPGAGQGTYGGPIGVPVPVG